MQVHKERYMALQISLGSAGYTGTGMLVVFPQCFAFLYLFLGCLNGLIIRMRNSIPANVLLNIRNCAQLHGTVGTRRSLDFLSQHIQYRLHFCKFHNLSIDTYQYASLYHYSVRLHALLVFKRVRTSPQLVVICGCAHTMHTHANFLLQVIITYEYVTIAYRSWYVGAGGKCGNRKGSADTSSEGFRPLGHWHSHGTFPMRSCLCIMYMCMRESMRAWRLLCV